METTRISVKYLTTKELKKGHFLLDGALSDPKPLFKLKKKPYPHPKSDHLLILDCESVHPSVNSGTKIFSTDFRHRIGELVG